jgi:hypothetical protein
MLYLLLFWEKNKKEKREKRNGQGLFSQGWSWHALLTVPGGIFVTVKCNLKLI